MDRESGSPLIKERETADDILNGRFKVIQKKRGYRFSVDALLLAHFVQPGKGCHILDLGTGSGVIPLLLAHRRPGSRIVGIDIQKDMADMARRTLALNRLDDHIEIREGDIRRIGDHVSARSFDVVCANPPYRRLSSGRINPEGEKARARHEISGSLADFLQAAAYALKPGGRVYLIYPTRRLVELVYRMRLQHLEPKRCRIVHSCPESRGELILVEGAAGGREELQVEPPLFIHDGQGNYTAAMLSVFSDLAFSPGAGGDRSPSSSPAEESPSVPDQRR